MDENEQIAAELKDLENNIEYLKNEKQKGWLSTSKHEQLAQDRARREEIMAKVGGTTPIYQRAVDLSTVK
jgi:cell division protein FtsB